MTQAARIRGEQLRRLDNANSIMSIPNALMICPGKRSKLWNLAINGEPVYAEPPSVPFGAWHLRLWEHRVRLVPCDVSPGPEDFTGNPEDYRPTMQLVSGMPRRSTGMPR
jgi:hypothetical protein